MRTSLASSILVSCLVTSLATAQGDEFSNPKPVSVGSYGPFSSVGATSSVPLV
ncbi:MAG: hypothetical protein H6835_16085 [Planctomycetes bacterium]|nr:hypothetical protein [Planctomycetota bacterium]